ncbi:prolyl oligopeptidase family serine peptidase [Mycoplasmopsis agassizii]|uniref:S9 family peptidase n=1 Tax=Mycoplasmopsis agassizii TaxID=33922 RepID=UPI0035271EFA
MKQISIREFFKTRDYSSFRLNPSATKLAYLKKINQRSNLFVKDLKTEEEVQLTNYSDRSIHSIGWINDNNMFFLKDKGGDENDHLYIVDLETKTFEDVTNYEEVKVAGVGSFIEEVFYEKKMHFQDIIEVLHNDRNKNYFDTYHYNIKTKEWKMLVQNDDNIVSTLRDDDYKLKYLVKGISGGSEIYKVDENENLTKIKFVSSKDELSLVHQYPDGSVLALSNVNRDKISLVKYNADLDEERAKLIYEDDLVDLQDVILDSRQEYKIIALIMDKEYLEIKWYDEEKQKQYQHVKDLIKAKYPWFGNSYLFQLSSDIDLKHKIYVSSSDDMLNQYFYYDKEKDTVELIYYQETNLTPENLTKMKPISFKARDGLTIHGYLTLPKNQKGPYPLILNVHGGPWVRDSWGYDSETQFFANRGYAVLQVNYRISVGYGKKFFLAGWKQWGLAMQDDLTDATYWAIEQGYAIKDKIAIYGGSYGGYAALMGIVKEPDLYAASVDIVGVSNLFALWDSMPPYWRTPGNIFEEALGDPYLNEEYAKSVSPYFHADKIKTPLMIVQGANDPRVPLEQSELMISALKKNNIDVEYMLKDDEGHGFANEENRFEMYEKVEMFLAKYLKK